MGFIEERFPTGISYGSGGGPGFSTRVVESDAGDRQKIRRRSSARRRYAAAEAVKRLSDLVEIMEFYISVGGIANSFRFKDFFDFTTASDHTGTHTSTDVTIGTGDGSETEFQLIKVYSLGSFTHTRTITKPVSGTVLASLDDVTTTAFTVDTTTGKITFDSAPGLGVSIKAGFEFDVPVSFDDSIDDGIYLSMDQFEEGSIPDVPLIEDLNPSSESDQTFYGGAKNHGTVSSNLTIGLTDGRLHVVAPDTASLQVRMPLTTNLPFGGPILAVSNTGTETITVAANDGTTIVSLPVDTMVELWIGPDSNGDKEWVSK